MSPHLHVLDRVDSTNSHALRELGAGRAAHLEGWRAITQDRGRGRRGAAWVALPGDSLTMSVVVRGAWPWAGALSLVAGLAVLEAVDAACGEGAAARLAVDWPNDVVAASGGRATPSAEGHAFIEAPKVAGVLIEGRTGPDGTDHVVGIGVNVRGELGSDLHAERSVATLAELGLDVTAQALGEALHAALARRVRRVEAALAAGTFDALGAEVCAAYAAAARLADGDVLVRLTDAEVVGQLTRFAPDGLVVATRTGAVRASLEHVLGLHALAPRT